MFVYRNTFLIQTKMFFVKERCLVHLKPFNDRFQGISGLKKQPLVRIKKINSLPLSLKQRRQLLILI